MVNFPVHYPYIILPYVCKHLNTCFLLVKNVNVQYHAVIANYVA